MAALSNASDPPPAASENDAGALYVHIIDVGQADAILIIQDDAAMLVDAGNPEDGERVRDYIKAQGVRSLTYIVGTHPHADHIGGIPDVLSAFDTGAVFLPYAEHGTRTYERLLDTIIDKNMTATVPLPGERYTLGGADMTMLSPPENADFEDLNDHSVAFVLDFEDVSMLFTGDMGRAAEKVILDAGYDITADILKAGHHGSKTASSPAFLDAVNPACAVMTTAPNAKSNLPAKTILRRYEEHGIRVFRTDLEGNIIIRMDEGSYTIETAAGTSYDSAAQ